MTFTNIPTFICKDREDVTFALKFHVPRDGKDLGLEVKEVIKKLKKGVSVVVPGASRGGVKDGKQGFIEVRPEEIMTIPTSIGNLIFMSGNPLIVATAKEGYEEVVFCDGCGDEKGREEVARCKGCGTARYCGKVCGVSFVNGSCG